ncbi:MAG: S26 family signal peptidase [Myxococcales bacterium]|nr:S26 family signal peptidase [Myxococcales bacterium]
MPPHLSPSTAQTLSPTQALFLPDLLAGWKLFVFQERRPAGILVRSLADREIRLLSPQQSVIRCEASATWLKRWGDLRLAQLWLPTTGSSMEPWLRAGDQVAVHPCSWRSIRVGQILVFGIEERWIIHRVVAFQEQPPGPMHRMVQTWKGLLNLHSAQSIDPTTWRCWTRGDNRAHLDDPIQSHQILGYATQARRNERPIPFDSTMQRAHNALRETKRLLR